MITFLVLLFALLLLLVSYFLLQKQTVFFALIPENEDNQDFLRTFGLLYLIGGLAGFVFAYLGKTGFTTVYLIVTLLIAALFSILFSTKMNKPKGS